MLFAQGKLNLHLSGWFCRIQINLHKWKTEILNLKFELQEVYESINYKLTI